ncbi:MAG: HD domain-containing protein [Chloracidobacterium sp.]|uniref:HD domain-containing protein n=1 Tax=Chloracidobacterium validum TaxID=2821543 RepID=A0ABX8B7U5_9BACT|nr:HD domain-containing protein [Chloracidobacterium validum]QUW03027.1 HD domain-containing protein [Chloracidobacterium validum]
MLSERYDEALLFAHHLHRQQKRKGGTTPYIAHLLSVSALVLEHGGTEDQAIAALLHDAVEDQGGDATRQEIRRRFGAQVAAIVDDCTDSDQIPKPPWRARKEAYLAHLRTRPATSRLVSLADKVHNARAILADYRVVGEALWSRFEGRRDGTLWYYRTLVEVFAGSQPAALVNELERTVRELEHLASSTAPQAEPRP